MLSSTRVALSDTRITAIRFIWIVLLLVGYLTLPPASFWYEARSIVVHDTVVGEPPHMDVDRVIHRDFRGAWVVTVMRKGPNGFHVFCTARGWNDFSAEAALPDPLDLNWWTWPTECRLPAGTYHLRTLWTIYPENLPMTRQVRYVSNAFEVR